jgi:hypothetical protein
VDYLDEKTGKTIDLSGLRISPSKNTELTELDALAEKIFLKSVLYDYEKDNTTVVHPESAYKIAEHFLNYRESRKQNG